MHGLSLRRLQDAAAQDPLRLVLRGAVLFVFLFVAEAGIDDLVKHYPPLSALPETVYGLLLLSLLFRDSVRVPAVLVLGALGYVAVTTMPDPTRDHAFWGSLATALGAAFYAHSRRWFLLGAWWPVAIGWGVVEELRGPPEAHGFTLQGVVPVLGVSSAFGLGVGIARVRRRAAEIEVARLAARRRAERLSLARELHDSVARDLTIITMQSAVLRSTQDAGDQEIARSAIEETARSGLDSLKRLLVVLRAEDAVEEPELMRDLEADSVELATQEVARHLTLLGFQITIGPIPGGLSPAAATTAVRVIREAATNVTKHAPAGALCTIDIQRGGDVVLVRVASDLADTTPERVPSTGLGLESLSERLRLLGGTLTAGPSGDRWVVEATIPATPPLAGTIRA